jgi:hypothetical protein
VLTFQPQRNIDSSSIVVQVQDLAQVRGRKDSFECRIHVVHGKKAADCALIEGESLKDACVNQPLEGPESG